MSLKLFVPGGASLQFNGGQSLLPSQVYFVGMGGPSAKGGLVSFTVLPHFSLLSSTTRKRLPPWLQTRSKTRRLGTFRVA